MSQMGQKRRFERRPITSGLPRLTDINRPARLVQFVPIPEVGGLYSITSLALASKVWGIVRPSAFAFFLLPFHWVI